MLIIQPPDSMIDTSQNTLLTLTPLQPIWLSQYIRTCIVANETITVLVLPLPRSWREAYRESLSLTCTCQHRQQKTKYFIYLVRQNNLK